MRGGEDVEIAPLLLHDRLWLAQHSGRGYLSEANPAGSGKLVGAADMVARPPAEPAFGAEAERDMAYRGRSADLDGAPAAGGDRPGDASSRHGRASGSHQRRHSQSCNRRPHGDPLLPVRFNPLRPQGVAEPLAGFALDASMNLRFLLAPLAALALGGCGGPKAEDEAPAPANEAAAQAPVGDSGVPPGISRPAHPEPVRSDTIPFAFHGMYDAPAAAAAGCGRRTELRLDVSASELRFHESAGIVRGVTIDGPRSIHVAADYRGEGERRREVRQLRLSEDGSRLTVAGGGAETVRIRCDVRPAPQPSTRWDVASSGEGAALFLAHFHRGGERVLTLFCPARSNDLLVNVPAFRPVASEERMSFGAGGTAVTLVADPRGDRRRGGVTGRTGLPGELRSILSGPASLAVNYGSQNAGPYAPPARELASNFLAGCVR